MIIHKKPKKTLFIFLGLFILLLLTVPIGKKYYKNSYLSIYDKILTYDTGFSSIHNLFGDGSVGKLDNYPKVFKKLPKVFSNALFAEANKNNIERIDIEIKFKNFLTLLEDRKKSINNGVGLNFREVNAKINYRGKSIDAKVRLKGDLEDHWRSIYKMSLRVNLKGENSIMGFRKFSIHKPSARQHPYDQTFQDMQRQLDNISSQNNYINVYVNGERWGIMNIEEHVSKEFLERQGLKESLILKFENEKIWKYWKMVKDQYENYRLSDDNLHINIYNGEEYMNNDTYRSWYSYISSETLKPYSEIYDNDSFSKSLLLALSWNRTHTLAPANSRYYFNPYTLRIEPITTDQAYYSELIDSIRLPQLYYKIIDTDNFQNNFQNNIKHVVDVIDNSQSTINYWQSYFPLDERLDTKILKENVKKVSENFKKFIVNDSEKIIKKTRISKQQSDLLIDHIYARHHENGEIHIYNLIDEPIRISKIKFDGIDYKVLDSLYLDGFTKGYKPLKINTGLIGLLDKRIIIETEHLNNFREFEIGYTHLVNNLWNPLVEKFDSKKFSYIENVLDNSYRFKKGSWNITEPIVLDGDLLIEGNTTLTFNDNAYLIVKGSINFNGTDSNKIILKPRKESWKGIYVLEANNRSKMQNVIIQGTTFMKDGILSLTGGINFYKSDVDIINSKFLKSSAEDALNIIQSDFKMENVSIEDSDSDGFDSDFSTGQIINSSFSNIKGDAIDFSGSSISVSDSQFYNIKDKAVSSGEASELWLENLIIKNVGVGIASKDGSKTFVKNSSIENFALSALMTYVKKSLYTSPELEADNIIIDNFENAFMRETKSFMVVNGIEIEESLIDVKSLYEGEIMMK